ncbi:hypothetical protein F5Y03DRAFT_388342 [Xylaria venustula]|nr:hypothetical protein F5Y03DRAFT_388342 [Xylaria venustula]
MKTTVLLVAMLVVVTGAFENWPLVCISNPLMQLVAGTTNVSAINEGLYGKCRALFQFADPDFVPITYFFTPTVPCSGTRVASFLVPPEAPNGNARVIWQCEQLSACSFAVVSNGTRDQLLAPEQNGTATPTGITGVNSATRLFIPPWTIVTITHTVTTLLTTTLTT